MQESFFDQAPKSLGFSIIIQILIESFIILKNCMQKHQMCFSMENV